MKLLGMILLMIGALLIIFAIPEPKKGRKTIWTEYFGQAAPVLAPNPYASITVSVLRQS